MIDDNPQVPDAIIGQEAAEALLSAAEESLASLQELADIVVADPNHDIGIAARAESARRALVIAIEKANQL